MLKLEVGKYYRSRAGDKWRVLATNAVGSYPVVAEISDGQVETFTAEGFCSLSCKCGEDLLSEWTDGPKVDWAAMPKWAKAVAFVPQMLMWAHFENVPRPSECPAGWIFSGVIGLIPDAYAPKMPTSDWRWQDSLILRPAGE
jgi:hypothetical protein